MSKPTHNFNPYACHLSSSIPNLKPCFLFTHLLVVLLVLEFRSIYTLITSRHDVPYCTPLLIIEYNSYISMMVFYLFHDAPVICQLVNCAQCKLWGSELPFNTDVIYHSTYSIYFAMIPAKTLSDILDTSWVSSFFSLKSLVFGSRTVLPVDHQTFIMLLSSISFWYDLARVLCAGSNFLH